MTDKLRPTPSAHLSPFFPTEAQTAVRVDSQCDRFEEAWANGEKPRIEDWLDDFPTEARAALLIELIGIEIDRCPDTSPSTIAKQLAERFPGDQHLIDQVLQRLQTDDHSDTDAGRPASATELLDSLEIHHLVALDTLETIVAFADGLDPASMTAEQLAAWCVADGHLSDYQSRKILSGLAGSLVLGNYVIQRRLGRGGMAEVYHARHHDLERDVAIKTLHPRLADSTTALDRFRKEIKTLARLRHPNIVLAYDAETTGDRAFLVMELVDGIDLHSLVKRDGPLDVDLAIDLTLQAARTLEYAHQQDIVHRDVKPANLMVADQTTLMVLDLGLANVDTIVSETEPGYDDTALADTDHRLTHTDMVIGTPNFIAPEQATDPRNSSARSDIYSLGCTLFFLLTGRPPFSASSRAHALALHQQPERPNLAGSRADISPELVDVFDRMVAVAPDERYQSMTEVADALEQSLTRTGVRGEAANRTTRQWPLVGLSLAAMLLVGLSIAFTSGTFDSSDQHSVPQSPIPKGLVNSIGMSLAVVPAGTFRMGGDVNLLRPERQNETPAHQVTLTQTVLMGRHEVTRKEFATVMGRVPIFVTGRSKKPPSQGDPTGDSLPVAYITWEEAARFCLMLSKLPAEQRAGRHYRLPTEAEWEYACRAGSTSTYNFGDSNQADRFHADRSHKGPVTVGSFSANAWGFYDMHGNVAEWVADRYDDRYLSDTAQVDPTGPGSGVVANMVIRGGGWSQRFVESFDMWGDYQRHLHSSFNVIVHTESDGLTRYWQPQQAGREGFVRYQYHFASPIVSGRLWGNMLALGDKSNVILEVAEAIGGGAEAYVEAIEGLHEDWETGQVDISQAVSGATRIFVQARMRVEKGESTYKAQLLRSSPASHFTFPNVYQLIVELEESDCRSAMRGYAPASFRDAAIGFRVVCEVVDR